MKPITMKPMAQACRIFMYSIGGVVSQGLTGLVGLGTLVEEVDGIVREVLHLLRVVLVLVLSSRLRCR